MPARQDSHLAGGLATVPLDRHEGIGGSEPNAKESGCARWPQTLRLASTSGLLVPGRCRSTRQCDYCARLAAVEWCELLTLDALNGLVLTTAEVKPSLDRVKAAKKALVEAVRARWPGAEYVCLLEFTTGRGTRARGSRRPHWNWLWKGIPDGDLDELRALVVTHWQAHLDAADEAQHVGTVYAVGGLMKYLALHFLKESQRPPVWWHGHRVTRSRGYLWLPTWKAREEAQRSLRFKRELHRAELEGFELADAHAVAEVRQTVALSVRWECVELSIDTETGELTRARPIHGRDTVLAPQRPLNPPGHGTMAEWEALREFLARRTSIRPADGLRCAVLSNGRTEPGTEQMAIRETEPLDPAQQTRAK